MSSAYYKGFAITARTYQIRGSGRWSLDVIIGNRARIRTFSGPVTYATEAAAIDACRAFGAEIIDGKVKDCDISDLWVRR